MSELHEDPIGRQRLAFERSTDESGDEVLLVKCWADPTGGVPPHIHPAQNEYFEVLEGEMTFTAGREKKVVRAGEAINVPPGTRHAYENRSKAQVHMVVTVKPPADLESFLTMTARLGREGHLARVGPLRGPRGLRSLPHVALLLERHRENTVILNPPPILQRLIYPLAKRAEKQG